MKKVHLNLFIICVSILFVRCENSNRSATLSVTIEDFENDSIMIAMTPYNKTLSEKVTTIYAKDGKFVLDTLIETLHYGKITVNQMFKTLPNGKKIMIPSKIMRFFIQPNEKVEITGNLRELGTNYQIIGNALNNQYLKYREFVMKDIKEISKLSYEIESSHLNNSPDSTINRLERKQEKSYDSYHVKSLQFIQENLNFEYSSFLLLNRRKGEIIRLYPSLDENVRKSKFGLLVKQKVDTWNQISIGNEAPDFEYTSLNNQKIRLSNYRGKYVVLDFWGTWCNPCKREIPELKTFYNDNKDYFEMIGIACRDTKENLEKAVNTYDIKWTQIFNNKDQQDLTKKYGIIGFPTKIVINPKGVIEEIYVGSENDFFIRMKELLNRKINL